ncbi:hypothetical protein [Nostoc sp. UHCC 0251]|nr:hypothetical protein [Nostoc sp. UHCC 0251]MEA5623344.1 hypothetical protein [Nostoc sp. UHCC 0251]
MVYKDVAPMRRLVPQTGEILWQQHAPYVSLIASTTSFTTKIGLL